MATCCFEMETAPDYQLLAHFVAVADAQSYSKAAKKLGVSKGTVSKAIARLEAVVGAELIHRTTHRVALSTAGAALYAETAPHVVALDAALRGLPERGDEPSGELRVTAPTDFGAVVLPNVLAEFARRYPKVSFDLRLSNTNIDLVAEGYDLAIRARAGRLEDSRLTVRRLATVKPQVVAAPSYLARRGRPRHIGEEGHDWILHPAVPRLWKLPRGATRFLVDDFFLAREMAARGVGVTVLPSFVATPLVREGMLEEVTVAEQAAPVVQLVVVYASSGQLPPKVRAFRDHLVESLRRPQT